jgi:hypothetical protein
MSVKKSNTWAWVVGVLLVMAVLGGIGGSSDSSSDNSTGSGGRLSETVFDDDSCYAMSAQLLRDYPNVYYSRQEAYDGCRAAGGLADELVGEVNRH